MGLCQPRRHTSALVVLPLPLYGLCLGSPPFSPQSRGLRRARAGRGAPRRPTRIGAWARAAPEARSRPGPRCTMGNRRREGRWYRALGAAFFINLRCDTGTRQTAVRANLTPAVSRFGSGLYRYCISYNVRWAVRCMASACRAVSAVSCMARHRVTGLPAVPRPPASPPNSPPRASSRRVRADLRHGVQ